MFLSLQHTGIIMIIMLKYEHRYPQLWDQEMFLVQLLASDIIPKIFQHMQN